MTGPAFMVASEPHNNKYTHKDDERLFFRVSKARVLWRENCLVLRVNGDLRMSMADLEGVFCGGIRGLTAPETQKIFATATLSLEGAENASIS